MGSFLEIIELLMLKSFSYLGGVPKYLTSVLFVSFLGFTHRVDPREFISPSNIVLGFGLYLLI